MNFACDLSRGMDRALDDLYCFALYSAANAMQRAYRPLLEAEGLTFPQLMVLVSLGDGAGPRVVGQLGAGLGLETSTLTPLLKRLEGMGLVTRRRDSEDERRVVVALSPEGTAARARVIDVPRCLFAAVGLSDERLEAMRDDLMDVTGRLRGA